jgi:hypothetical protein
VENIVCPVVISLPIVLLGLLVWLESASNLAPKPLKPWLVEKAKPVTSGSVKTIVASNSAPVPGRGLAKPMSVRLLVRVTVIAKSIKHACRDSVCNDVAFRTIVQTAPVVTKVFVTQDAKKMPIVRLD